jgi:hypothetical protein
MPQNNANDMSRMPQNNANDMSRMPHSNANLHWHNVMK